MTRTLVTGTSTSAGSVTVYWYGTTTKPTIYDVPTGGSGISNPITAAYDGAYAFWVDDGHYTVVNGTPTGNRELRVQATPAGQAVPGTAPSSINFLPFLASTTSTLEAFYEGVVGGTQTMAGGTFTGPVTTTSTTASTSTTTGSIITAGGIGAAKDSFFGGLIEWITANGSGCIISSASELLTLSTSGATTDTSANLLPANSIILGVTARVTTTITTATDWQLGDPTTAGRFTAANSTLTAGTTDIGILQWSGAVTTLAEGPSQPAAAKVRVTTTGTPGAGAIRITVWYLQLVAPTS